ncbi:MAG: tRNA pseudouridine(38-40) synthase TruA [Pseudomonadota bacterium]
MPRYRIDIEYDGSPFVGWQIQTNGWSVQGALSEALQRLTGEAVRPGGAGRTDTGVHATGQCAHFDLTRTWSPDKLRDGLNFHLKPDPVAVLRALQVPNDFDARFSATARHYRYQILNRRARPALDRDRVWLVPVPIDAAAMDEAAQALVGHHDFTTYRAAACQSASPVKTLDRLRVKRDGQMVIIEASARSFLHNQVRSLVGSLKLVGEGKWSPERPHHALQARDRRQCGALAPPSGLFLQQVDYADAYGGPSGWIDPSRKSI